MACGKLRLCTKPGRPCQLWSGAGWWEVPPGHWLGVSPDNYDWLYVLEDLLLEMHGPKWRDHSFIGCARNTSGGWYEHPPLIEDVLTVKRAQVPLSPQEIGALRWHSCKSTMPSYMTHFGVTTRTVRFQGAWKKASEAMPHLHLKESQTRVLRGQVQVLDQSCHTSPGRL